MRTTTLQYRKWTPWVSVASVALLGGCQAIGIDLKGVSDAVSALADPLVAQAVVIGFEDPDAKELQFLVDAGLLQSGTMINVYVANAANAANIAKAPVNGARVVLETEDDAFGAPRIGEGSYSIDPTDAISYEDEEEWTLWIDAGREEASWIDVILPPAAELDFPPHPGIGKDIELDLTGQGYNSADIWVYDEHGIPTWANFPTTITELYNQSLATDPLLDVVIPGTAFPRAGTYTIAFGAMVHNSDEQLSDLNKLLSRGMSGKVRFYQVTIEK
ncbi:MAG: hypothetical protein R3F59_15485 [Myxococcota bacterium]